MDKYICRPNNLNKSCIASPCKVKVTQGSQEPLVCLYNMKFGCTWRKVVDNKQSFSKVRTKLAFDFRSNDENE